MSFSVEQLRAIVARASTLAERLERETVMIDDDDCAVVGRRFDRWAALTCRNDMEAVHRLLGWDGLSIANFRKALGPVRLNPSAALPQWAHTLQAAVECADCTPADGRGDAPIEAFVQLAQRQLATSAGAAYALLDDAAHAALARDLRTRLTSQGARAWQWRSTLRRRRPGPAALTDFMDHYPMLARLLATQVNQWIASHTEFLERLQTDRQALGPTFAGGADPGTVVAISPALSEPHHDGRQVLGLGFESGLKLVYKPRSIAMEAAFRRLLNWLDQRGSPMSFRTPLFLQRPAYGWIEFVSAQPCHDAQEAHRYFERAGALLCLVHVLEGMDVHQENLIACGEHPVLIDLETLLHPRPAQPIGAADSAPTKIENQALEHSVLRTGMLPYSESFFDYHLPEDISGLGGSAASGAAYFADSGHDAHAESIGPTRGANLPFRDARVLRPEDHEEPLVAGFSRMYWFLDEHRERLLADDGPLPWLAAAEARFLFRDTRTYALLCERLWHPPYLRDGADWSIEMAVLYRAAARLRDRPSYWPLVRIEMAALQQVDVPVFTVSPAAAVVRTQVGDTVGDLFEASSLSLVRRRIAGLCKDDMERQVDFIRRSLSRARSGGGAGPPAMPMDESAHADVSSGFLIGRTAQ
jgi:type 2 lantibiotic biosynthesis protein LanM